MAFPAPHCRCLLLLLLLAGSALVPGPATACTSIVVGRGASADGSVILARSDDGEDAREPNSLWGHPASDGPLSWRSNVNNFTFELPTSLAYTAWPVFATVAQPAHNPSGESHGVNAAGVAISATESMFNSRRALVADPYDENEGVVEDAIPSLLLAQARSAQHAAELLGQMIESMGAGEGFGECRQAGVGAVVAVVAACSLPDRRSSACLAGCLAAAPPRPAHPPPQPTPPCPALPCPTCRRADG